MMRLCGGVTVGLLLLATAAPVAAAQSLADIARNEEARRKRASTARTYTNADLSASNVTTEAPSITAAEPAPAPAVVPAEDGRPAARVEEDPATGRVNINTGKAEQELDEAYWRRIARDLRGRFARAESDVAAAESELAALAPGEAHETRESTTATLMRRRKDVRLLSDELTRFLNRARTSNVPSDWVR